MSVVQQQAPFAQGLKTGTLNVAEGALGATARRDLVALHCIGVIDGEPALNLGPGAPLDWCFDVSASGLTEPGLPFGMNTLSTMLRPPAMDQIGDTREAPCSMWRCQ